MHPDSELRSTPIYGRRRPLGRAPWNPRGDLPDAIGEVLREYRDYWPLTARQVYYRLVGKGVLSKTDKGAAERVQDALVRGRRSGRWRWWAIRDDGAVVTGRGGGWSGLPEHLDHLREQWRSYRRDRHASQPVRVVVWCEARGMAPALADAVSGLPVRVVSGGGSPSVTLIQDEAVAIRDAGKPTILLYVGDLDKHGKQIEDRIASDLDAFLQDDLVDDAMLLFKTIAVTDAQVQSMGLIEDPASPGSYQAEAIPPDELATLVREAVRRELDLTKLAETRRAEWFDRLNLARKLRKL